MIEKVKQAYQRLGAEKAVDLMRTEMGKKGRERKKERELERVRERDLQGLLSTGRSHM